MSINQHQNSTLCRQFKLRNDTLEALLKKQKFQSGHYQRKQQHDDDYEVEAKKKLLSELNDKSCIYLNKWKEQEEQTR